MYYMRLCGADHPPSPVPAAPRSPSTIPQLTRWYTKVDPSGQKTGSACPAIDAVTKHVGAPIFPKQRRCKCLCSFEGLRALGSHFRTQVSDAFNKDGQATIPARGAAQSVCGGGHFTGGYVEWAASRVLRRLALALGHHKGNRTDVHVGGAGSRTQNAICEVAGASINLVVERNQSRPSQT